MRRGNWEVLKVWRDHLCSLNFFRGVKDGVLKFDGGKHPFMFPALRTSMCGTWTCTFKENSCSSWWSNDILHSVESKVLSPWCKIISHITTNFISFDIFFTFFLPKVSSFVMCLTAHITFINIFTIILIEIFHSFEFLFFSFFWGFLSFQQFWMNGWKPLLI